jgi:hypothetical protein
MKAINRSPGRSFGDEVLFSIRRASGVFRSVRRVFVSPEDGQTVRLGEPAEFFARTRGFEGFDAPIAFSVTQWSTQRFPDAKDGSTLPLTATLPSSVQPGDTATLHFETTGADPGIYYVRIEASGGGMSQSFDVALVLT